MSHIKPLPAYLVERYHGWRASRFEENKAWHRRLAEEGQRPPLMVISCCDSRVNVNAVFGGQVGDIFLHRNIASLVPPYLPDGDPHGTSAAVEYAVRFLKVSHLVVMGHSQCGGVKGCHDMCAGHAPEFEQSTSFIGRWLDILRPGYDRVAKIADDAERVQALEHEAVIVSVENLMTFPFVAEAVEAGELSVHGTWIDLGKGELLGFSPESGDFSAL